LIYFKQAFLFGCATGQRPYPPSCDQAIHHSAFASVLAIPQIHTAHMSLSLHWLLSFTLLDNRLHLILPPLF